MPESGLSLDELCINTIRFLAVDAIEKAKSGHPGAPLGAAPMAYVLWDRFLKHNPRDPAWTDRDRFVLSAGHASMLLYALLHLTGYDLPLEEIKSFRQWHSMTPGHPEHGMAPGIEATTGPLGQGFANAVGMAIAEARLAAEFNGPGHEIVDHHTFVLASDGDLQEGVCAEAASLAGHLRLGKLKVLYDDNAVQLSGPTALAFSEDVPERFRACGWHTLGPVDGNDLIALDAALSEARAETSRPSLISVKTVIGYGSPEAGSFHVHGEPLGEENARAAKEALGWPLEPMFYEPEEAMAHMGKAVDRGAEAEREWQERMDAYATANPELAAQFAARMRGELPTGWDAGLDALFPPDTKPMATRSASQKAMNVLAKRVPALIGGSGDLTPSTKTLLDGEADFGPQERGRNLHFGVREHAMGAICTGMALHGGFIPYGATFLTFSDYMRGSIRLAALTGVHVVYVFTHDSIGLGEDGPTHQPIEHLMALRVMPNLTVIRPGDATEAAQAWRAAVAHPSGPVALILTRQNVPVLDRTKLAPAEGLLRGAYVLWESGGGMPDVIFIGTGSEVSVALEAGLRLADEGWAVRVVSMPSWELFDRQPADYRESVLPAAVKARVAVEAGVRLGWEHYVGLEGAVVGLNGFGASAPGQVCMEKFGITADHAVEAAKALLGG
jgi:transketolase